MKSRSILTVVSAVRRQWIIVSTILLVGLLFAALAAYLIPAKFTAGTSILMVAEPAGASTPQVPLTATKPVLAVDLPALATNALVLSRLRSDIGESTPLGQLRSRIRAKVATDSGIMPIEFTGRTASEAIRGVNALGNEITRFYRELATRRFDSLIADLDRQLASQRTALLLFDRKLAIAARAYPYVDVKSPGASSDLSSSVYQRLIALRVERDELAATVNADLENAHATEALIRDARSPAERDLAETDPVYKSLHEQYAKDLTQLHSLEAFGKSNYPGLADLRETVAREAQGVASARQSIVRNGPGANSSYATALDARAKAAGQTSADRAKLAQINATLSGIYAQMSQDGTASSIASIRRDRDNLESTYATLAARRAKTIADRAEAASTGSVVVLDPARYATRATFTSGSTIAVGISVLALWGAFTLAVLIDEGQGRFQDAATMESVYGTRVIGSIA